MARITIQLVQPDEPNAAPQVLVDHPPDDQLCGLMMWTASKLIGENLRKLHEEQRVRIAQTLPGNGGGLLAG
jgi:hypothetical protein